MFEFSIKEEENVVHISRSGNIPEAIGWLVISILKLIKHYTLEDIVPKKDMSQVVASNDSDKKE